MVKIDNAKHLQKRECKFEFARLISQGVRRVDAYRQAFNKPYVSDAAAKMGACRMLRDDTVCEKLAELEARADDNAVLSRHERMVILSRMICRCEEAGDVSGLVRCIAELNRMDGAYEAWKVEAKTEQRDFSWIMREILNETSQEPLVKGSGATA